MADVSSMAGTAAVTDRRPVPQGVLPRRMQAWLMASVAAGMVLIIFLAGRPAPAARQSQATTPAAASPNPDRLREYQDRLRVSELRAAQEAQIGAVAQPRASTYVQEPTAASAPDPVVSERKRREYESLFASNVVLSRRPDSERPESARQTSASPGTTAAPNVTGTAPAPTVDQIADAVVRATVRAGGAVAAPPPIASAPIVSAFRG